MKIILPLVLFSLFALPAAAQQQFERDTIKTTAGELQIFFVGHGSLMMQFNGKTIQIDPFSSLADYTKLPKADLILITHEHQDHLDTAAIEKVRTKDTQVLLTEAAVEKLAGATVMKNGDARTAFGITIEAVPAYNLIHKRENGQPFHPKGRGNGYVLTFGDKRVYVAGDTE
ncbi:MAG: metal-dependent hydrolase, partial [Nitrospirae bacterium GWC2_57_9]